MDRAVRLFFIVCVLSLPVVPAFAQDVPQPQGRVNDFANVISPEYKEKISTLIAELEGKTSAEIAVVTQKSIAPYDEFQYAQKVFDEWKIGKKDKDNGVLILVAVEERAWRIHTGYGVEGILPDAVCSRIGREQMVPFLKKGDYSQGIFTAVAAIADIISKDASINLNGLEGVDLKSHASESMPFAMLLFAFFFFLIWNFPWPIFIGLPFSLIFASAFTQSSPLGGFLVMAGWTGAMIMRYFYWLKQPADTRGSFWSLFIFGLVSGAGRGGRGGGWYTGGGGWSSGGGGYSGGGGFGGGSSGGGGAGGRF